MHLHVYETTTGNTHVSPTLLAVRELLVENGDYTVTIRVIDKDNAPQWCPSRLQDVTEAAVEAYFAPLGDRELRFD